MLKPRFHVPLADSARSLEESRGGVTREALEARNKPPWGNSTALNEESGMRGTVPQRTPSQLAQPLLRLEERRSDRCQDTSRKEAGNQIAQ